MTAGSEAERLTELAHRWCVADPDPVTRALVASMLERGDVDELREHFGRPLAFGTAGIRGTLGPGPARMNRLLVHRVVAGVAGHLLATVDGAARRGVVLGRDARHGSDAFADEAAEVLLAHGIDVHRFDGPVPTPLAVFAVRHLGAAAGLVVTASHNPPSDNGLKVVWSDGAQIAPPVDAGIAAAIDAVPLGERPPPAPRRGTLHHLGTPRDDTPVVAAYLGRAHALAGGARNVRVAATALHGVGADLLERALTHSGAAELHLVGSQRSPDPDFPTVASPNPEDPAALREVVELATEVGADVALALDPDADRLAAAVAASDGGWRVLTGDELGVLLLHRMLERTRDVPDRLVATTVVTSRLGARMCAAAGVHHHETLTGFKWLCRPGLEHPELRQVLIYEEALGYAAGSDARDKDGITSAALLLDLLSALGGRGPAVADVLDDLARRHGAFVTRNRATVVDGPDALARMDAAAQRLVEAPPRELGGFRVGSFDLPAADVVRLLLEDDTRVVVRPSGTEPKLKHYLDAVEPVAAGEDPDTARERARRRLDAIEASLRELLPR